MVHPLVLPVIGFADCNAQFEQLISGIYTFTKYRPLVGLLSLCGTWSSSVSGLDKQWNCSEQYVLQI